MLGTRSILMIKSKLNNGNTVEEIHRQTGFSRTTVRKYREQNYRPHASKGIKKASKLDPYKEQLQSLMDGGIFNCAVLYDAICEKGYDGKRSILRDYVHPFRPPAQSAAVRRYETKPGEQAQMDWGISSFYNVLTGEIQKTAFFAMILSHSRAKYIEFTSRADQKSLERCILNACEYFGGVPETILTDNMKTVVDHRENGRAVFNKEFEDFAAQLGFIPFVCRPYRPQTKGKVERLVGFVKHNFLEGRSFTDIEDLNRQAMEWVRTKDALPHGTTGKIPLQELAKEPLNQLPEQSVRDSFRWEKRKVARDGSISFDGILYRVPWEYSGKEVNVRLNHGTVEVFDDQVKLVSYKAGHSKGRCRHHSGLYAGLSACGGRTVPQTSAFQTPFSVAARDLRFYDQFMKSESYDRT